MSTTPLVSVIIPTYNAAHFLLRTLDSVLSQDYPKVEIIVIDDGSTDETDRVVAYYIPRGVSYIRQENSGGPSKPRNVGIRKAAGKYVFLLDSDDLMLPSKIRRSVAFLEKSPDIGLLFTDFVVIDEAGSRSDRSFLATYPGFQALPRRSVDDDIYVIQRDAAHAGLIAENFIGTSGVAVPRHVFEEIGWFDEQLRSSEDRDLWFRIASKYDIGYLQMIGHCYRVRAGGITQRDALLNAPDRIEVFRRQLKRELPFGLRRQVNKWIASNYMSMGWSHYRRGEMRAARYNYLLGLQQYPSWPLLKGALATLVPRRLTSRGQDT